MPGQTNTQQVSLRMRPDIKRVLLQGAAITGQSLTDFMVASSTDRARQLLQQQRTIVLGQEGFDAVVAALNDPEPWPLTPLAARAIAEYAASVREDGTLDW